MKVEQSPALFVGVLGLGLLQVVGLYRSCAPSLQDMRAQAPGDMVARQQLMDTNILIGSATLVVAVSASVVMKSVWPLLFLFGGFVAVAGWHHLVLNSPQVS